MDLAKLRPASWSGIPEQHRPVCWQLLLGYLPSNPEWRADTLQRKRREYWASVPQYFDVDDAERSQYEKDTLHQVLPLTHPDPDPHHPTFTAHHSPFTPNLTPTLTLTLTLTLTRCTRS